MRPSSAPEDPELVAQREALTRQLSARNPNVAISLWSPLQEPSNPCSFRLLAYNAAFMYLCDAVSFGDGAAEHVLPSTAVIRSQPLAHEVAAAIQRSFKIFSFIQAGKSTFAATKTFHLSKKGNLRRVDAEWYLLTSRTAEKQVLLAEFKSEEETAQFTTSAPPQSTPIATAADTEPLPLDRAPQQQQAQLPSMSNMSIVFDAGNKARRWTTWSTYGTSPASSPVKPSVCRKRSGTPTPDFKCIECGVVETMQKRCAERRSRFGHFLAQIWSACRSSLLLNLQARTNWGTESLQSMRPQVEARDAGAEEGRPRERPPVAEKGNSVGSGAAQRRECHAHVQL